jgi:putative hydrolase of the HAD superfamily
MSARLTLAAGRRYRGCVQPSVVFFDFHDTLGRYEPHHLVLYEQAAAEHGVTLDRTTFDGTERQSWIDDAWAEWRTPLGVDHSAASTDAASYGELRVALHRRRFEAAGVERAAVEHIARRLAELESDPRHFVLFDDTRPALAALRERGSRSFIVSNHIWELPAVASGLGLDGLVEEVLTSARVGYRKPHPAIYATALRAAGVAASEALFVGDSWSHDVEGPRAAGMEALLIDREGASGRPGAIASLLELPLLDAATRERA